jgi:type VII secretion-associated serine protease mycosin
MVNRRVLGSGLVAAVAALAVLAATPAYADEVRDKQWSLRMLGAEEAWKVTRGDGEVVAVLDSGVDADLPDLRGQVLAGRNVVDDNDDTSDSDGHGTAVATLIAGNDDEAGVVGLAPEAKILPVKVGGAKMYDADVADGIRWAVEHHADVINMSLGSERSSTSIADAVAYAIDHDVVVVAAAGNIDEHGDGIPIGYPARLPGVIAVTGITAESRHWQYSSRGPRAALCAPATGVVAPHDGGYDYVGGTSFASPMVAAAAALVRAEWPDMSAANVVNRLVRTATDLGRKGRDSEYGFGRVNLAKAVTAEVPEVSGNPLLLGWNQRAVTSKPKPPGDKSAAPRRSNTAGVAILLAGLLVLCGVAATLGWLLWRRQLLQRQSARWRPVPAAAVAYPAATPLPARGQRR